MSQASQASGASVVMRRVMVGLACVSLSIAACASEKEAASPNRALPSYSGHAADVFDDSIEPSAVGLDFDRGYAARTDPALLERAHTSDAVLRVRVSTVTTKKDGPEAVYQLGLHIAEKLSGDNAPSADFYVTINKASESHGIMKSFENRLVGYSFIAFVREFVRPDGDREVHFHLAPDTKEVKLAVSDAMLLRK